MSSITSVADKTKDKSHIFTVLHTFTTKYQHNWGIIFSPLMSLLLNLTDGDSVTNATRIFNLCPHSEQGHWAGRTLIRPHNVHDLRPWQWSSHTAPAVAKSRVSCVQCTSSLMLLEDSILSLQWCSRFVNKSLVLFFLLDHTFSVSE
jgi:hypothetical protein